MVVLSRAPDAPSLSTPMAALAWVREGKHPNRSRAVQAAVNLLSEREKRTRLARELAKLDHREEQRMAEEGLGDSWAAF